MTTTAITPSIDLTTGSATQQDAQIMLQLSQLWASLGVADGMAILSAGDAPMTAEEYEQRCPKGSAGRTAVSSVLQWYETVGTLVKNGLFDRALTYDWLLVHGIWDLCAPIAQAQREQYGEIGLWENFELLAEGQRAQTPA
jgi:hypothetical protein